MLNLLFVVLLWIMLFWVSLRAIQVELDFSFLGEFRIRVWDGFLVTLGLSLFSLLPSLCDRSAERCRTGFAPACCKIFL